YKFILAIGYWCLSPSYCKISWSIATKAASPGSPKNPETAAVIKLIGICNEKWLPIILKKNKSNAPTISLMQAWPIHFNGFTDAPNRRSKKMQEVTTEISMSQLNV